MPRTHSKPDNYTTCPTCKRDVGVQREFHMSTRAAVVGNNGWRIARHGYDAAGSRPCPDSRTVVSELVVVNRRTAEALTA